MIILQQTEGRRLFVFVSFFIIFVFLYVFLYFCIPIFVANGDVVVVIKDDNLAAKQKDAALYLYYFHFIFISVSLYICFFCISVFFFVANGDVVRSVPQNWSG